MVKKQIENKLVNKVAKQGMRFTGFTAGSLTQAVGMPHMIGENFVEILASDKVLVGKNDRDGLVGLISEDAGLTVMSIVVDPVGNAVGVKLFKVTVPSSSLTSPTFVPYITPSVPMI